MVQPAARRPDPARATVWSDQTTEKIFEKVTKKTNMITYSLFLFKVLNSILFSNLNNYKQNWDRHFNLFSKPALTRQSICGRASFR